MIRFALSFLVLACWADASIVTSTTCTATGFASMSNPTSCSITVAPSVTTNASISPGTLVINSAGVSSGFANSQAVAIPPLPPLNGPGTQASASAKGSLSAELATGGPVRSGYILLSENIVLTNGPGAPVVGTADVTIGSLSTTCSAVNSPLPGANCTGSLAAANGHIFPFVQLPFTLGQAFLLSEDVSLFASLQSSQLSIDGDSTGTGMLSVGFSFTDLNGAPVQAYAVPEPKSWALLLAGSFVLAGWSFARLSQKVRRM